MLKVTSLLNCGIEARSLHVEVAMRFSLPSFVITGLPSQEVRESRERILAAFEASGLEFPQKKIIVNLSPADVQKSGRGLDLPIALAVGGFSFQISERLAAWGELGLDGSIAPAGFEIRSIKAAAEAKVEWLFFSKKAEPNLASWSSAIEHSTWLENPLRVCFIETLTDLFQALSALESKRDWPHLLLQRKFSPVDPRAALANPENEPSLSLPPFLNRVVSAAALGQHHLLLIGPKGIGKSLSLQWLASLRGPIGEQQRLKKQLLMELAGGDSCGALPIRRVSSNVSNSALIGSYRGGQWTPGEFAKANFGLLIADEFFEWNRQVRESLREPLEQGFITVNRAGHSETFETDFQFAATANLCPCGGWPRFLPLPGALHPNPCHCTASESQRYWKRLSGPIGDRIDLVVRVSPAPAPPQNRNSQRVELSKICSRMLQSISKPAGKLNASETETLIQNHKVLKEGLLELAPESLRTRHKTARIAITLCFLDGGDLSSLNKTHLMEANLYRAGHESLLLDRKVSHG